MTAAGRMPVLFVGHGSPMNALEDNEFSALYQVRYPAPGSAWLARETGAAARKFAIGMDREWGLDHGCWSVRRRMYPAADVPVVLPLLYVLGLKEKSESISYFNDEAVAGSLTMTSLLLS
jgi:aromatic ring-opening dioxygenase catalytic subunit (LigB family)